MIRIHAEKSLRKELDKLNKKIKLKSDKLKELHEMNSTVRRRAMARVDLSCLCEERDRYERALEILKEDE